MQILWCSASYNAASGTSPTSAQGCRGDAYGSPAARRGNHQYHSVHHLITRKQGPANDGAWTRLQSPASRLEGSTYHTEEVGPTNSHINSQVGRFNTLQATDGHIPMCAHNSLLEEVRLFTDQKKYSWCSQYSIVIHKQRAASTTQ